MNSGKNSLFSKSFVSGICFSLTEEASNGGEQDSLCADVGDT